MSWTIVSWMFLIVSHPEGMPSPPLDIGQMLLLLPGVLGLAIAERLAPTVGQPVAFFSALLLIVLSSRRLRRLALLLSAESPECVSIDAAGPDFTTRNSGPLCSRVP